MNEPWNDSHLQWICGIDEVGRGPLAGPVVVSAVVLPRLHGIRGLNDSKKLSEKSREALFCQILEKGVVSCVSASAERIDQLNILQATLWCMRQALAALPICPDAVFVDGRDWPFKGLPIKGMAVIGGDQLVESISAASIIAKVLRDRAMKHLDAHYPEYGFARHKGYGTAQHLKALADHGACPIHRKSFKPCSSF